MELSAKRVMIVGLGVSGRDAARFVAARGAHLVLTDSNPNLNLANLPTGEVHLGVESESWLDGVDLMIASPGVPRDSKLLAGASARGISVIGEIELASRFISAPIAAITGTNGKSTVTVLLGEIMKAGGRRTFVGGNLGTPLIDAIGVEYDVVVAEVSSFQLETIEQFHPRVAIHLNLTDDHFDRYDGLEDYGRAKARIFENQNTNDFAILNRDDPNVFKLAREVRSHVVTFGMSKPEFRSAIWPVEHVIVFDFGSHHGQINLDGFHLTGRHNIANAMAAAGAALALGVEPQVIERALTEFKGLPHRIQLVYEKNGVRWIDDSKGTNVGAVVEAIDATRAPIILIAGGVDKGGDYSLLRRPLGEKVRLAIFNGAARDKMRDALAGATEIAVVPTLKDAVNEAAQAACPGDSVLMSPACSSFDQFKDYAHRGKVFEELVRAL